MYDVYEGINREEGGGGGGCSYREATPSQHLTHKYYNKDEWG